MDTKRLENSKQQLLDLASVLDDVINGKATKVSVAEKLGFSPTHFTHCEDANFTNYVKSSGIFTRNDMMDLLRDLDLPIERLIRDVIRIESVTDKIVLIPVEAETFFVDAMRKYLTEREYKAVCLRYGLEEYPIESGEKYRTYEEIGKEFCLTRERVRQIIVKALRKLRRPECVSVLSPFYGDYIRTLEQIHEFENTNERIETRHANATKKRDFLISQKRFIDRMEQLEEEVKDCFLLSDEDWISEKAVLKLNMNNIYSVFDLINAGPNKIFEILGKTDDFSEIRKMYGFLWKATDFVSPSDDIPLTDMELSVRSYNCLYRHGCQTVGDVAKMSLRELAHVRNLGKKSCEEVINVLWNDYGIRLKEETA